MKRLLRLCACLLTLAVLCGSLSGCLMLDNARANHAQLTANGRIRLNGAEYMPIPDSEYFLNMHISDRLVFVTEEDVPVLLSPLWGSTVDISQDGMILRSHLTIEDSLYCRADKYDAVKQRLEKGFTPSGYCYEYYDYSGSFDSFVSFEDIKPNYYTLTPEQVEVVNTVYRTVTPDVFSYEEEPPYDYYAYDYYASLWAHSEDHLLHQDSFLEIHVVGNDCFLLSYTDEEMLIYNAPAEYADEFAAILAPVIQAESKWEDWSNELLEDFEEEDYSALEGLLGM